MANPKGAAAPEPQEPLYPTLEGLVEYATREEVGGIFNELKENLAGLKGPKAAQGQKIGAAIGRTEELLQHLLDIRERLTADASSRKGRR